MRIPGAVAAACLAVAASTSSPAAQAGAQSQAPTPQQPTFRVATNLVEVDVVVLDKQGRFVPGLTAEDLEVFEDGKKMSVQQFYLVTNAAIAASARDEAPSPDRGRRIFIFMFDEGHLSNESMARVKVGAERFLATQFGPGDVGGVYANGAMFKGRLTTSKTEILQGIRSVTPALDKRSDLLAAFREFPAIPSEADAVRIDYGDRRLLDEIAEKVCQKSPEECQREGGAQQVHSRIEDKAKDYVRLARVLTAQTVQKLNIVASNLGGVPGRKTIIMLSDGFFTDEVRADLQQIAAIAARGGATFYTIFGRGSETVGGRTTDVTTTEPGSVSTHDTSEDGAEILSAGTGGFVLRNLNDVSRALGLVARDTSTYYVMGYQPDNTVMDGKLRKIEVKAKTDELRVRARKGYIASPLPPMQSIRIGG
jgi:VWFA-related protein